MVEYLILYTMYSVRSVTLTQETPNVVGALLGESLDAQLLEIDLHTQSVLPEQYTKW